VGVRIWTRTWLQLLSCTLIAHSVLIWKAESDREKRQKPKLIFRLKLQVEQVGIYTKTVFHMEQVWKGSNGKHRVEYHKHIGKDETCGVVQSRTEV